MAPKIFLLGLVAGISILVPGSYGKPQGQPPTSNVIRNAPQQPPLQIQIQAQAQPQPQQVNQVPIQISNPGPGTYFQVQRPNVIPITQYIPSSQPNIGAQVPIAIPINGGIQGYPGPIAGPGPNFQIIGGPPTQQQLPQSNNGVIYVLVPQGSQQSPINSGVPGYQLIPISSQGQSIPNSQPQVVQIQLPQAQAPQIQQQQEVQAQIEIVKSVEVPTGTYKPQQPTYTPVKPETPKVQVSSGTYQPAQPTYQKPQIKATYQQPQTKKPDGVYQPNIPTEKPKQNSGTYEPIIGAEIDQELSQGLNVQLNPDESSDEPQPRELKF